MKRYAPREAAKTLGILLLLAAFCIASGCITDVHGLIVVGAYIAICAVIFVSFGLIKAIRERKAASQ